MANKISSVTKVVIPCRISFANIFEAKSINGGEAKYSVSCLIPKEDKKTLLAIHKAVEAAKEDGKTRKWGGKIPPNLKLPLRDGDIDRPDDENYQEHFFVNASSKDAPQVVDRHVQPVTDPMMVYSGCYCNVSVNFYAFMAASLTLPMALKDVGAVLKTSQQKDKEGERLIKLFSMPCKPTKSNGMRTRNLPEHYPADWEKFKYYCIQDVNTEVDIYKRLKKFPMPEQEWKHYRVNERINDRGVKIDTELVQQAIACDLMLSDAMSKKAYELTGLENPNSVSQLKSWLDERGIPMDTLGKKDVAQMIEELDKNGVDAEAMDMLKLRLQMAKSSVKKYQAAERCVCSDGRARGLFQFYGASRTGRYSGRNIQLQNLPQNHISTLDEARELVKLGCFDMVETIYGNTPDVLSQLIRTMLIPREGCEFIVADFSAIEARVLAWEAGEDWRLEAFLEGKDIYCASASQMFHVPVVKHGINGELRQKGKVAELACGYGGSSGALISMGALQMGLKEEELPEIIDSWREANPKIVQYWWDVEKAATQAFKTGKRQEIGKLAFEFYSGTLWMLLPSGRKLAYLKPRLQPNRFGRMSLTYEGVGQNHKWARQETYSGRLVENATQAIARDILAEAMARMEGYGLNIVGHVHDEVIIEAPKDQYTVDEVCKLMSVNPEWCKDLPLNAAGYKGSYYFTVCPMR